MLSNTKKNLVLYSQRKSDHTFAKSEGDNMFNNSFGKSDEEICIKQSTLHNRMSQLQQQKHTNFDTYPPKRNLKKSHQQLKEKNDSLSASNILQVTKLKRIMPSRSSPLRNTNTGKFYTKRIAKRSFSESSAEKLQRYTTSDSSTSQEEDELMMRVSDKRKMTRNPWNAGIKHHKYQPLQMQQRAHRKSQRIDSDKNLVGCLRIFGEHSEYVSDIIDIGIRVILVVVFSKLETQTAFKRIIHSEEIWMYKNPRTKDFVSPLALLVAVIFGPFFTTLVHLGLTNDRRDFRAANWAWTLILGLNGLLTSLLKISVGRPRPDYYYRCFPDGVMQLWNNSTGTENMLDLFNCTGSAHDINEGHKSFPSGHSSFAFAGFGFITYYVGAKLHAFNHHGRGESWRLCISITPLVLAALVAVSRTCDYHHHWQDVIVGSLIGLFVSYCIYRQYYPSIFSPYCHRAYPRGINSSLIKAKPEHITQPHNRKRLHSYKRILSEECGEANLVCEGQGDSGVTAESYKKALLSEQKTDNKWS